MKQFQELSPAQKIQLIDNRWKASSPVWEKLGADYERNESIWRNDPDWVKRISERKSKVRVNRTFLAMETVVSRLTSRPAKPNAVGANGTEEAMQIAEDVQRFMLRQYDERDTAEHVKRMLRSLFFAKLGVLKVFWDAELDSFSVKAVDPRRVRFAPHASGVRDTEYAIEEIDIALRELLAKFPTKEKEIMNTAGLTDEQVLVENPKVMYREAWVEHGKYVLSIFKDTILAEGKNPYWDWDGLKMNEQERGSLGKVSGKRRRDQMRLLKDSQEERAAGTEQWESYLYNHLDRPLPPYIFGSVLNTIDSPTGRTSLIEQVAPIQEEIDRIQQQVSDNARMMNGIWKVDTDLVNITKGQAEAIRADVEGLVFGPGVSQGVQREVGKELPSFILNYVQHLILQLDSIFGTNDTFRGEQGKAETATGRSILQQEGYQRLSELVKFVDTVHLQLYNWWFQLMKVKFTEAHYVKTLGGEKAAEVVELTQDDLEEGIEIRIVPGQALPTDQAIKAERATEGMKAGLVDPVTYFKAVGDEAPEETAKRAILYKLNPLSIVSLDDEDMARLQQAQVMMQMMQPEQEAQPAGQPAQAAPAAPQEPQVDPRAEQLAQVRQETEALIQSQEFQQLPDEKKAQVIDAIEERMAALAQA